MVTVEENVVAELRALMAPVEAAMVTAPVNVLVPVLEPSNNVPVTEVVPFTVKVAVLRSNFPAVMVREARTLVPDKVTIWLFVLVMVTAGQFGAVPVKAALKVRVAVCPVTFHRN